MILEASLKSLEGKKTAPQKPTYFFSARYYKKKTP